MKLPEDGIMVGGGEQFFHPKITNQMVDPMVGFDEWICDKKISHQNRRFEILDSGSGSGSVANWQRSVAN